jgi:hypothetical protein
MNPNPHPITPEDIEDFRRGVGEPIPPEVRQATAQVAAMTSSPYLIDHAQESAWRAYRAMQAPVGCDQQGRHAERTGSVLDRPADIREEWEDDYDLPADWTAVEWFVIAFVAGLLFLGAIGWPA